MTSGTGEGVVHLSSHVVARIFDLGAEARKRLSGELPRDEARLLQIRDELKRLSAWLGHPIR